MGVFHKLCVFCQNKKGLLNTGFYCEITGEDLVQRRTKLRSIFVPNAKHKWLKRKTNIIEQNVRLTR